MYRILGRPPSSDYVEVAEKDILYVPSAQTGRARLFLTEDRKLKVKWSDGTLSEFAKVIPSFLGQFRNRIINGDFQIWQRGTSVTGVAGWAYYTADRWKSGTTSGNYNQEKSTMNGFNSLKTTVNTIPDLSVSTALFLPFYYIFEGSHLYDLAIQQKPVTISFLFRSNVTGAFCVVLRHYRTGTNVNSFVHEFTYPVAGAVQKVVVTIPLDAAWGEPPANDNNIGFVLSIAPLGGSSRQTSTLDTWLSGDFHVSATATNWASAAGNFVEIAQVQLEEGDTATDFEWVPYDVQLLRCMRYYCRQYYLFQGYSDAAGIIYASSSFKPNVPMRAVPTVIPNRVGNLNVDPSLFVEASPSIISPVGQNFIVRTQATGAGRTFWVGDVILDAEL